MVSIKQIVLAGAFAAFGPAAALAADMGYAPPVIAEEAIPQEIGSGWYLRGDVGYARAAKPDVSYNGTKLTGPAGADTYTLGIGAGYKFGDWLRADATLDVMGDYKVYWDRPTPSCYGVAACTTAARDRVSPTVIPILANAYLDFGRFSGITPYVGGGIGLAYVRVPSFTDQVGGTYTFRTSERLSFAASAAAGVSFDIGDGIAVDAGYRYLWVDKGASGAGTSAAGATLPSQVTLTNNVFHTVRIGLRYYLN